MFSAGLGVLAPPWSSPVSLESGVGGARHTALGWGGAPSPHSSDRCRSPYHLVAVTGPLIVRTRTGWVAAT